MDTIVLEDTMKQFFALLLLLITFPIVPAQSSTDPGDMVITNRQSGTTYTVKSSDRNRVVIFTNAGTKAVSLPIFSTGWYTWFYNTGAGAATITPVSGTIDGGATLALPSDTSCKVVRDSTGYIVTQWAPVSGTSGVTNSAGANVIPKSDGTNLVASGITDNGSVVTTVAPSAIFNNTPIWGAGEGTGDDFKIATDGLGSPGAITKYMSTQPGDGNILIGRTSSGSFRLNNLTAGSGISVVNGAGSITLALSNAPLSGLATQATNTVVGNATSGTAAPTALAVGTCSTAGSALIWTTNTGFGCNTSITAAAVPASGLTGTTLASGVVTSSLTTVGTIGSGAWQGTVINSTYGGMGVNNAGRTLTLNTNSGTIAFSASSKTVTFAKTLSFDGTDSTTMTFPSTSATIARTDAANTFTGASSTTSWAETTPVITGGLTASGSGANTFGSSTGTFVTSTGANTISGAVTFNSTLSMGGTAITFGALPSGATTAGALDTYAPQTYTVTGTNTATAFQGTYHGVVTVTDASAGTVTDLFGENWAGPAAVAGSLTGTRKHTLGVLDSTGAASSITGALIVAATYGTTATSVGIGGGNINAGGTGTFGGTLAVTGVTTLGTGSGAPLVVNGGSTQNVIVWQQGGTDIGALTTNAGLIVVNGRGANWYDGGSLASPGNLKVVIGPTPGVHIAAGFMLGWNSAASISGSPDTALSRDSAGVIDFGTGTAASTAGSWKATAGTLSGAFINSGITSDAAHTDTSVCQDSTTHQFYSGSGTLGVCLGTSSARFKPYIADLPVGLAQIMALKPVQYRLDAQHGDPNKLLYGFTAEQGGSILPDLMGRDVKGNPNTFDYLGIVPILVRAIQEQQKQIDELKARQ